MCMSKYIILNTDPYIWLYFILQLSNKIHYDCYIKQPRAENTAGILKYRSW
jgi:hypothetical protein